MPARHTPLNPEDSGPDGPGERAWIDCPVPCRRFGDGHALHPIRARLLGQHPWGWRPAVVRLIADHEALLSYACGTTLRVWHHRSLAHRLAGVEQVLVHEEYRGMGLPDEDPNRYAVLGVEMDGGLGLVDESDDPGLWRRSWAVVDLATGEGILGLER